MIEIGRICIKLAGRDAGREAVIIDLLDDNYVLIDGNVRRRKCNILHLEPTEKKIDIKKGASHEDVKNEFSKLNLPVWETKSKQKVEKPVKIRGKKKAQEETGKQPDKKKKAKEKEVKAEIKKEEAKEAEFKVLEKKEVEKKKQKRKTSSKREEPH